MLVLSLTNRCCFHPYAFSSLYIESVTSVREADISDVFFVADSNAFISQRLSRLLDAFGSCKLTGQFAVAPQFSVKFKCEAFCVCLCVGSSACATSAQMTEGESQHVHLRACAYTCVCVCLSV